MFCEVKVTSLKAQGAELKNTFGLITTNGESYNSKSLIELYSEIRARHLARRISISFTGDG